MSPRLETGSEVSVVSIPASPTVPDAPTAPAVNDLADIPRYDRDGRVNLEDMPVTPRAFDYLRKGSSSRHAFRAFSPRETIVQLAFALGRQITLAEAQILFADDGEETVCAGCDRRFQPVRSHPLDTRVLAGKAPPAREPSCSTLQAYGDLAPFLLANREGEVAEFGNFLVAEENGHGTLIPLCGTFAQSDRRSCLGIARDARRSRKADPRCFSRAAALEICEEIVARSRREQERHARIAKLVSRGTHGGQRANGGAFGKNGRRNRD